MSDPQNTKHFLLGFATLGFQILGFMVIFGFIGYKLDDYFNNDGTQFLSFGLLFGVVASLVYTINALLMKNKKN